MESLPITVTMNLHWVRAVRVESFRPDISNAIRISFVGADGHSTFAVTVFDLATDDASRLVAALRTLEPAPANEPEAV